MNSPKEDDSRDSGSSGSDSSTHGLDRFRGYLRLLAELELGQALAPRVDPSDLVQETLLRAHRARDQFRGSSDESRMAWLRSILANTAATTFREHFRDRRDMRREVSLERSIEQSSERVAAFIGDISSASSRIQRGEILLQVSGVLTDLPAEQRRVFLLRHWRGMTVQQIADELGKTRPAVAGVLRRAMIAVRAALPAEES